jgi:hypothetical protein
MAENESISKLVTQEDDMMKGISYNQNRQKHRRGKRKHRRRTYSNEMRGEDTNVNHPKDSLKFKTTYPPVTKELYKPGNVDKRNTFDTLEPNAVPLKQVELIKCNESESAERKKKRPQRGHRPHRYHKNVQKHRSATVNQFCPSGESSNSKLLILRPTRGQLMNAPRNSTQFIIDDHEDEEKGHIRLVYYFL